MTSRITHLARPRLLMALAPLVLVAACQEPAAQTNETERPVQVFRVSFARQTPAREFVGVVRARYETDVGFRVAGKIITRNVNLGDRLQAGDVVARLDPQDLRLQVESSEAELAAAKSNFAEAVADEERYASLKARGYAAIADFDRKLTAKDEAEGRLLRAQRSLDLARNQRAYSELTADADGVVTATLAEPGQVVAVGQPVIRLARRGEKEVLVALPETWLEEARASDAAVRLWSDPDRQFAAHLRELSPQADPTSRTYQARFSIEQPDDTVALGMTATLILSRHVDVQVARLPLAAVLNRGGGPMVYVVDGDPGALEIRPVTVAAFTEDAALVAAGLKDGERVVALGGQKLQAGLRVRTVETP